MYYTNILHKVKEGLIISFAPVLLYQMEPGAGLKICTLYIEYYAGMHRFIYIGLNICVVAISTSKELIQLDTLLQIYLLAEPCVKHGNISAECS